MMTALETATRTLRSKLTSFSGADERLLDELVLLEWTRRAFEHHPAVGQHVAAMCDRQRRVRVMFRQQHHRSGTIDLRDGVQRRLHQLRCEAERRFVEQQQ